MSEDGQRMQGKRVKRKWIKEGLADGKPGKTTIMDKSLGTLLHFGGVFKFTWVQPSPHPTNNVGRVYPEFFQSFNFVHCMGFGGGRTEWKFRKE